MSAKRLLLSLFFVATFIWGKSWFQQQDVQFPEEQKVASSPSWMEELGYQESTVEVSPHRIAINQETNLVKVSSQNPSVAKKAKKKKYTQLKALKKKRGKVVKKKKAVAKKDKKKKESKKKKETKKKTEVAQKNKPQDKEVQDIQEKKESQQVVYGGIPTSNTNSQKDGEGENERQTTEDWLAFLGANPGFKKIDQMVKAFEAGEINNSVYYEVARELLSRSSEKSQILGVRLVGSVKTADSFVVLVEISNENLPTRIKQNATLYLRSYETLSHLNILAEVLRFSDVTTQTKMNAMAKAEIARRKALQATTDLNASSTTEEDNSNLQDLPAMQNFLQIISQQASIETNSELAQRYSDFISRNTVASL